ncbi:hypothetical protein HDV01_002647 [Terramyces sp. JEL0728]|nr:hypothetical protein HDV01_002647 [Terramyces sp. JEL0728]
MKVLYINVETIKDLSFSCSEFLVHATDVEGLCRGIDERLVTKLGEWCTIPTTYAGGGKELSDLDLVKRLSNGKIDLTFGSALDIFGGNQIKFVDAVNWNNNKDYLKAKLSQQELEKPEIHLDPYPIEYKPTKHASPKKKIPLQEEDYSSGSNFWKLAQSGDTNNDIPMKSIKPKSELNSVFMTKAPYGKPDSSVAKLLKKIKQHETDEVPLDEKILKEGEIWYFDNLARSRAVAKLICNSVEQLLKVYSLDGITLIATVNLTNASHVGSEIGVEPKFIVQTITKAFTFGVDSVTHRDTWINHIKKYVKDKQYKESESIETLNERLEPLSAEEVARINLLSSKIADSAGQITNIVQQRINGNDSKFEEPTFDNTEIIQKLDTDKDELSKKLEEINTKTIREISDLIAGAGNPHMESKALNSIVEEMISNEKLIRQLINKVDGIEKNITHISAEMENKEPVISGTTPSFIQIDRPTKNIIVSMNDKLIQLARLQEHAADTHAAKMTSLEKRVSTSKGIDTKEILDQVYGIQKSLDLKISKIEKQLNNAADNQKHIINLLQRKSSAHSNSSDSDDDHIQNLKDEFQDFKQLWRSEQRLSKDRMSQLVNMFSILQEAHTSILSKFKSFENSESSLKDKIHGFEGKLDRVIHEKENSEHLITQIHTNIASFIPLNLESKLFNIEKSLRDEGAYKTSNQIRQTIELVPFLNNICAVIETQMQGMPVESIIATIMTSFASSAILTGLTFLAIGYFKLGSIIHFFPRHILVGCIGGIGLFLVLTAIEVTAHEKFDLSFDYLTGILQAKKILLWGTSLIIAATLKLLQRYNKHALLIPAFYVFSFAMFWAIAGSLDISIESLRANGWLLDFVDGENVPFYEFWTYYDFGLVNWKAVAAMTFFGVLQVPIHVPALSVSTNQDIVFSDELFLHGVSNLLAGISGTLQNYMDYANSLFYIRSGGESKLSNVILICGTIILWIEGKEILFIIPSIVVGALIFHIGMDLIYESLIETVHDGIEPLEYATVLIITFIMGFVGFPEGIGAGVVLSCIFFVFMYSRSSPIRETFTGKDVSSTISRPFRQHMFLDKVGTQTRILKLQGFMFFGTANQLEESIKDMTSRSEPIRFIILDFALITGIGYSALETFKRVKRNLKKHNIHLILCNLGQFTQKLQSSGIFELDMDENNEMEERIVHILPTLNDSLEYTESFFLESLYNQTAEFSSIDIDSESPCNSPREKQLSIAAVTVLEGYQRPFKSLFQAILDSDSIDDEILEVFGAEFVKMEFKENQIVYKKRTAAHSLYILESGELALLSDSDTIVETVLPGCMIGDMELISNRPRICTLKCTSPAVAWALSRESFTKLTRSHPYLAVQFIRLIAMPFNSARLYNMVHHWAQLR